MFVELLSYAVARMGIDRFGSNQIIKGWPVSSYIVALVHQLVVLPYTWFALGDASACFHLTTAYFLSDLLLNTPFINREYALHHICSLVLLTGGPRLLSPEMIRVSCRWLVVLEFGSAGISLADLTGRFYTLRLVLYLTTRAMVVLHAVWTALTTPSTRVCCLMSAPLVAHNLRVANRMWVKHKKYVRERYQIRRERWRAQHLELK